MGEKATSTADRSPAAPARERSARLALLALWAVAVLYLAWHHVPWRDEVRALSIALQGEGMIEMLRGLQGEGHPALWYLLLRGAHMLVPVPQVLPALALLIAAGAMALLVWRAPFRPLTIALILFGAFGLHEFTIIARNYGMSMLLLFAIAALYPKWRDRGVLIGLLLALLCNTNVPANLIAAALLGFWLVELVSEEGLRWTRKHWIWAANAAVAAAGVLLCFLTVYPPAHDAAAVSVESNFTLSSVLGAIFNPAISFEDFLAPQLAGQFWVAPFLTVLLFGAVVGLAHRPAALLSALGTLVGLCLFFTLIYPSYYRHQALFLVFLITLYWLAANGRGGTWPERWRAERLGRATRLGGAAFTVLMAMQVATSIWLLTRQASDVPYSRARDVAELLEREGLGDAILMSDDDVLVEPMPYYVGNPLYLPRERRFGAVVAFDRHPRNDLTLDDLLGDARMLSAQHRRPVVLLLRIRPDPDDPPSRYRILQTASLTVDPEQVRRFQAEARLLASFGPAISDESYDVYLVTAG